MKLTPIQQLLAGLGIVVLALFLGEFFFHQGKKESIAATLTKIDELRGQVERARKIQERAAVLEAELNQLKEQLDALKNVLPVTVEHQKFFKDLRRLANEEGIEVHKTSRNGLVASNEIVEHPYTVLARGQYHDFGRFFAKLSTYPMLINVKGLFLTRTKEKNVSYSVEVGFIISLFTYKEPTPEDLKRQLEERKAAKKKG